MPFFPFFCRVAFPHILWSLVAFPHILGNETRLHNIWNILCKSASVSVYCLCPHFLFTVAHWMKKSWYSSLLLQGSYTLAHWLNRLKQILILQTFAVKTLLFFQTKPKKIYYLFRHELLHSLRYSSDWHPGLYLYVKYR